MGKNAELIALKAAELTGEEQISVWVVWDTRDLSAALWFRFFRLQSDGQNQLAWRCLLRNRLTSAIIRAFLPAEPSVNTHIEKHIQFQQFPQLSLNSSLHAHKHGARAGKKFEGRWKPVEKWGCEGKETHLTHSRGLLHLLVSSYSSFSCRNTL